MQTNVPMDHNPTEPNMPVARAIAVAFAAARQKRGFEALLLLHETCDPCANIQFPRDKWEELCGGVIPGVDEALELNGYEESAIPIPKLVRAGAGGALLDGAPESEDAAELEEADETFTAFHAKHEEMFRAKARRKCTNHHEAEELFANTREKTWIFWRSRGVMRTEVHFCKLFEMNMNWKFCDMVKKCSPDLYAPEILVTLFKHEASPKYLISRQDLNEAINSLQPMHAAAIRTRFYSYDSKSWRDCAEELGYETPYYFKEVFDEAIEVLRKLLK